MKRPLPPSKELCLHMAELQYESKNEKSMWDWLIVWGDYEHWVEHIYNEYN